MNFQTLGSRKLLSHGLNEESRIETLLIMGRKPLVIGNWSQSYFVDVLSSSLADIDLRYHRETCNIVSLGEIADGGVTVYCRSNQNFSVRFLVQGVMTISGIQNTDFLTSRFEIFEWRISFFFCEDTLDTFHSVSTYFKEKILGCVLWKNFLVLARPGQNSPKR